MPPPGAARDSALRHRGAAAPAAAAFPDTSPTAAHDSSFPSPSTLPSPSTSATAPLPTSATAPLPTPAQTHTSAPPLPGKRTTWVHRQRAWLCVALAVLVVGSLLVRIPPPSWLAPRRYLQAMVNRHAPAPVAAAAGVGDGEPLLRLTLLHTNDLHSAVTGTGPDLHPRLKRGGYAQLAHRIKAAQAAGPTLVLDAGDWFSGSIFDSLGPEQGEPHAPELEFFSAANYDAVIIGNHDFDAGVGGLLRMLDKAAQRNLSLNIISSNLERGLRPPARHAWPAPTRRPAAAAGDAADSAQAAARQGHANPLAASGRIGSYVVKEFPVVSSSSGTLRRPPHPLRVGVLGIMGPDAALLSLSNRGNVSFAGFVDAANELDMGRLVALLTRQVQWLQRHEKCDAVVAVLHGGLDEARVLASSVPGLDVIVSGHTHETYYHFEEQAGDAEAFTHIVQCGHAGETLGRVELVFGSDRRLRLRQLPTCDAVRGTDPTDDHLVRLVETWEEAADRNLGGGRSFRQLVYHRPDGHLFNSNHTDSEHALVVGEALLEQVNHELELQGRQAAHVYLTCPSCVRSRVSAVDGNVTLQVSDVYRMLAISAGHGLVVTHMHRDDLWRIINLVAVLRRVLSPEFVLTVAGTRYETRPWGIPFFNMLSDLRLVNISDAQAAPLPFDSWPERIRVATNGYLVGSEHSILNPIPNTCSTQQPPSSPDLTTGAVPVEGYRLFLGAALQPGGERLRRPGLL